MCAFRILRASPGRPRLPREETKGPVCLVRSSRRARSVTLLECAVEHPMKDASPEGVSRPKDLNVHLSLLKCAVTQNATLSALECAVPKTRPCKSFRMRSSEKKWGEGCSSDFPISIFEFRRRRPLFRFAVILRLDVEPAFDLLGHQVGANEGIQIAVEHAVYVADFKLRAVILDHLVGLHHVRADLAAKRNVSLGFVQLVGFR